MTTMADTENVILAFFTALGLGLYAVLAVFTDLELLRIFAVVFIVGFVMPQLLVRLIRSNSVG